MSGEFAIVPQPVEAEGYVALSRSKQGRLFEKQILNYGPLLYGSRTINIDDTFASTLIENFENKVCDIVQVPKAGANNEHSEDPDRNIGEVVGLSKRDNKVYAVIDARDEKAADNLGKTLLGASAMMNLNYTDTRTGKSVGPTLLHVAVTNRPYVVELEDYSEIIAMSADSSNGAVLLTAPSVEEKHKMTRDELFAELKADHNIDVPALQEVAGKVASAEKAIALSNAIDEKLVGTGIVKLSNGSDGVSAEDIVGAMATLSEKNVELTAKVDTLLQDGAKKAAEVEVDGLVASGHIVPANRDAMVELKLSNADLFAKLLPEAPVVKLSNEEGSDIDDGDQEDVTAADEIARIVSSRAASNYVGK